MGLFEFMVITEPRKDTNQIEQRITARFPDARFQYQDNQMKIVLSIRGWHMTPEGEEGFFGELYDGGFIGQWHKFHRRTGEIKWSR